MTRPPKLVAILNVTPDSFSDGGLLTPDAVFSSAQKLIAQGADVLDVGAESTRPDATPLSPDEEWARLAPIWSDLQDLCKQSGVLLSLDTRHAATAEKALNLGCDWINDVTAFQSSEMQDVVRGASCTLVAMHSIMIPAQKQIHLPEETDVIAFMRTWSSQTLDRLAHKGIVAERVILDAGIGFGKTAMQNLALLRNLAQWRSAKARLLIGHSRKSFLALFTDKPPTERDFLTRMLSASLALQGVDFLRVHDVAGHHNLLAALG